MIRSVLSLFTKPIRPRRGFFFTAMYLNLIRVQGRESGARVERAKKKAKRDRRQPLCIQLRWAKNPLTLHGAAPQLTMQFLFLIIQLYSIVRGYDRHSDPLKLNHQKLRPMIVVTWLRATLIIQPYCTIFKSITKYEASTQRRIRLG